MRQLALAFLLIGTQALPAPTPPHWNQIKTAAKQAGLDPKLVQAVIRAESNFNPEAQSHKGAFGLMQVMPRTAEECGIHRPKHVTNHLMGACFCLRKLINRYRGDLKLALAAYNAGVANVKKYDGIPPFKETQQYVKKVLKFYKELKNKG